MASGATTESLSARLLAGDVGALARALTLVENRSPQGRELIRTLFRRTGKAQVVGITGAPGAGKSTLVDQLIALHRQHGRKVAVLAVDPSSAFTKGAILGDRIRMSRHYEDSGVFVRSMSSRGQLGGIAATTWDAALLLDAAGWDVVLIETVGVGQDEVSIAQVAQATVLVVTPHMGDDVQAIKAGIMEIADVFAVNKADLGGADRLTEEIRSAQSIAMGAYGSDMAPICRISAVSGEGMTNLFNEIETVTQQRQGSFRDVERWSHRLRELLYDDLRQALPPVELSEHARQVAERTEDPYTAVALLKTSLDRA